MIWRIQILQFRLWMNSNTWIGITNFCRLWCVCYIYQPESLTELLWSDDLGVAPLLLLSLAASLYNFLLFLSARLSCKIEPQWKSSNHGNHAIMSATCLACVAVLGQCFAKICNNTNGGPIYWLTQYWIRFVSQLPITIQHTGHSTMSSPPKSTTYTHFDCEYQNVMHV